MTGSEMKYGALSAKVHALFGKRLRTEEFARLARMRDAADLLEALRRHPGWSRALSRAAYEDWSYVGRVEVEKALWEELDLEYLSLAHYVPREDRELMQFLVRLAERSAILHALRRLKAGKGAAGLPGRRGGCCGAGWTTRPCWSVLATTSCWPRPGRAFIILRCSTCGPGRESPCPTTPSPSACCARPTFPICTAWPSGSIPGRSKRFCSAPWGSRWTC